MTDPMKQLRAADPLRRADLGAVDDAAFAALREEILMTTTTDPASETPPASATSPASATPRVPDAPPSRRRRLGVRGAVALGLAGVLAGGGVAYAAIQAFRGSTGEGVSCVSVWDDDALEGRADAAGPWLTGDPYADCTTLLAEEGLPPIEDPVAFAWDGQTYVAPASEVPDGVERLEGASALDPAVVELQQSMGDRVDGGASACRSVAEGAVWAQEEIDRLGLEGWTVRGPGVADDGSASEDEPCFSPDVQVGDREVVVTGMADDPTVVYASPEIDPIVAALRAEIADRCVDLDEARAIVDEALASVDGPSPTTSVADERASCARVDLVVGGTVGATVYGPTTAG